jgi:hypothetical protein
MNTERDSKKLVNANPDAEVAGQQQPAGESDLDHRRETESERQQRIAVGAYYNAEHRGFGEGAELDDWLRAEQQYEKSIGENRTGRANPPTTTDERAEIDNQVIEPDEIRQWAPRLNVSATRLREAIKNTGNRLSDIKRYLSKPDQPAA